MGGADAVLERAREYFERGEYRWVAEVVNHVVFAEPQNRLARELQADALEQMGYQSESGPWRNAYLTGAHELRFGPLNIPFPGTATADTVRAMSLTLLFNYLAVRLNGPRAAGNELTINFEFTDTKEKAVLELANGSLNHTIGREQAGADATVRLARPALDRVILGETTLPDEARAGEIAVDPEIAPLERLVALLDDFEYWFNIIEP